MRRSCTDNIFTFDQEAIMVTEKMINDEEIKILLERIHEGNDALHEAIIKKLRTGVSIRRDVLEYL